MTCLGLCGHLDSLDVECLRSSKLPQGFSALVRIFDLHSNAEPRNTVRAPGREGIFVRSPGLPGSLLFLAAMLAVVPMASAQSPPPAMPSDQWAEEPLPISPAVSPPRL